MCVCVCGGFMYLHKSRPYMEDRDEYGETKQPGTGVQEDSLHIIKLLVREAFLKRHIKPTLNFNLNAAIRD